MTTDPSPAMLEAGKETLRTTALRQDDCEHLYDDALIRIYVRMRTVEERLRPKPTVEGCADLREAAMEAAERLYDLALCSPADSLAYRTNMRIAKRVSQAASAENTMKNDDIPETPARGGQCSFCSSEATTCRSDEHDLFACCVPCGEAWDADRGFHVASGKPG